MSNAASAPPIRLLIALSTYALFAIVESNENSVPVNSSPLPAVYVVSKLVSVQGTLTNISAPFNSTG